VLVTGGGAGWTDIDVSVTVCRGGAGRTEVVVTSDVAVKLVVSVVVSVVVVSKYNSSVSVMVTGGGIDVVTLVEVTVC
jgi:hypothetical protein